MCLCRFIRFKEIDFNLTFEVSMYAEIPGVHLAHAGESNGEEIRIHTTVDNL